MDQKDVNGGSNSTKIKQLQQLHEQLYKLLDSIYFCTPDNRKYKLKTDSMSVLELYTTGCIQLVEPEKELKISEKINKQPEGYSEKNNTLDSIFNGNTTQQNGGGEKIFSSTSNMFNGFQNGGYVNATTTSVNSELDLSIFSQLESGKNYKQNGGELSTLASVFD
jgi:hypothetical protein